MAPKRSSRSKAAAGMQQPTLTFQTRKPGAGTSKSKLTKTKDSTGADSPSRSSPSLKLSASESSIVEDTPGPLRSVDPQPSVTAVENGEKNDKGPRKQLDVRSKEWSGLVKHAQAEMAGMKPVHATPETHNDIHHVLRIFDMSSSYGPYTGISRLQRWERAKKLGLNPPEEIKRILTTQQGEEDISYRENVLYSWLG